MTKTRIPFHKKSAAQEIAGMDSNVTVTSASEISADSSGVKLEYLTTSAEVARAQVEPSANVSCLSSINTFSFSGNLLLCVSHSI